MYSKLLTEEPFGYLNRNPKKLRITLKNYISVFAGILKFLVPIFFGIIDILKIDILGLVLVLNKTEISYQWKRISQYKKE